ncbi:MAG TPA: hypothetical protein VE954_01870 [Oligoflexus sp.]|uniref:hypothetical protein n=1 Tax=Oligoflexus sp. TaxID=1971216 RepID=UPI002D38A0CA|nr:hypothetical protein [Oligoflexus sp.]HYX31832.1 hypothetical protein [Oligoflexus sp.]
MKPQFLLIPMLLLCCCRTTAGTKEKNAVTKPYAAEAEKLLMKKIDGLSKSQAQVYECTVTDKDVDNLDQVKKWIAQVPRDKSSMVKAMHFRATDPSVEYFAFEGSTPILMYEDHSALRFLGNEKGEQHSAVRALMEVADKHCPGQSK